VDGGNRGLRSLYGNFREWLVGEAGFGVDKYLTDWPGKAFEIYDSG
jgi:hypothetical protein